MRVLTSFLLLCAVASSAVGKGLLDTCLPLHGDASRKLNKAFALASGLTPRVSAAVFGRQSDGLMFVAEVVSSEFGHVQLLDMQKHAKLPRADTMKVIQDTLTASPSTLFVVTGMESLGPSVAALDLVQDLMDDGMYSVAGGASLNASAAGVLLAVNTDKLGRQPKNATDATGALEARLATTGDRTFTPSAFLARLFTTIVLPQLTKGEAVKLDQLRAPDAACGRVAMATARGAIAQSAPPTSAALAWQEHAHLILAACLVMFVLIFALRPGNMPPPDSLHHPGKCYAALDARQQAANAGQELEVDAGVGRPWKGAAAEEDILRPTPAGAGEAPPGTTLPAAKSKVRRRSVGKGKGKK